MTYSRVLVPSEPRYQNFIAPDYEPVQFLDDTGAPINLTGVNTSTGFTFVLQTISATPTTITCTGDWAITDAANGKAAFSFGLEDLATIALFAVYITVQLPGESTPRAFPFNALDVQQWNGGPLVTTQIDIEKLAGTQLTDSVPISAADNKIVTLGAKADASYAGGGGAASLVSLLRGIFDQTKQAVTQRALITPYGSNPSQTAAAAADTQFKWGTGGTTTVLGILMYNGSGADMRYAIDAASSAATFILADKQTVFIDVAAPITVLHLSTASQQYINHATNAGIFIQAWG